MRKMNNKSLNRYLNKNKKIDLYYSNFNFEFMKINKQKINNVNKIIIHNSKISFKINI